MAKHLAPYRTYIIRCWEEQRSQSSTSIYRFTLEIPATGERFGFTQSQKLIQALELALAHIQTQTEPDAALEDEPD
ncbi:hypothetical protein K9N68_37935 (plasmid) [Kovacikia minuta CCNUW1]|uniref:hypothetical protein n=1 Tax=Kovacikia minuta TaxID=2931930 RepID=UPI001CCC910A|nr:hypothetical protein [Kovacikia minuta]UBF29987.1 hypothetical protein K9N68_37935 [Kovacikia minuta CCNUW1]